MILKIPLVSVRVRWLSLRDVGRELREKRFLYHQRRWDKHAWTADVANCPNCHGYASNSLLVADGHFPCVKGRELLDKMYPDSAESRHAYFVSKGLKE